MDAIDSRLETVQTLDTTLSESRRMQEDRARVAADFIADDTR